MVEEADRHVEEVDGEAEVVDPDRYRDLDTDIFANSDRATECLDALVEGGRWEGEVGENFRVVVEHREEGYRVDVTYLRGLSQRHRDVFAVVRDALSRSRESVDLITQRIPDDDSRPKAGFSSVTVDYDGDAEDYASPGSTNTYNFSYIAPDQLALLFAELRRIDEFVTDEDEVDATLDEAFSARMQEVLDEREASRVLVDLASNGFAQYESAQFGVSFDFRIEGDAFVVSSSSIEEGRSIVIMADDLPDFIRNIKIAEGQVFGEFIGDRSEPDGDLGATNEDREMNFYREEVCNALLRGWRGCQAEYIQSCVRRGEDAMYVSTFERGGEGMRGRSGFVFAPADGEHVQVHDPNETMAPFMLRIDQVDEFLNHFNSTERALNTALGAADDFSLRMATMVSHFGLGSANTLEMQLLADNDIEHVKRGVVVVSGTDTDYRLRVGYANLPQLRERFRQHRGRMEDVPAFRGELSFRNFNALWRGWQTIQAERALLTDRTYNYVSAECEVYRMELQGEDDVRVTLHGSEVVYYVPLEELEAFFNAVNDAENAAVDAFDLAVCEYDQGNIRAEARAQLPVIWGRFISGGAVEVQPEDDGRFNVDSIVSSFSESIPADELEGFMRCLWDVHAGNRDRRGVNHGEFESGEMIATWGRQRVLNIQARLDERGFYMYATPSGEEFLIAQDGSNFRVYVAREEYPVITLRDNQIFDLVQAFEDGGQSLSCMDSAAGPVFSRLVDMALPRDLRGDFKHRTCGVITVGDSGRPHGPELFVAMEEWDQLIERAKVRPEIMSRFVELHQAWLARKASDISAAVADAGDEAYQYLSIFGLRATITPVEGGHDVVFAGAGLSCFVPEGSLHLFIKQMCGFENDALAWMQSREYIAGDAVSDRVGELLLNEWFGKVVMGDGARFQPGFPREGHSYVSFQGVRMQPAQVAGFMRHLASQDSVDIERIPEAWKGYELESVLEAGGYTAPNTGEVFQMKLREDGLAISITAPNGTPYAVARDGLAVAIELIDQADERVSRRGAWGKSVSDYLGEIWRDEISRKLSKVLPPAMKRIPSPSDASTERVIERERPPQDELADRLVEQRRYDVEPSRPRRRSDDWDLF